jgi:hypothetical protein
MIDGEHKRLLIRFDRADLHDRIPCERAAHDRTPMRRLMNLYGIPYFVIHDTMVQRHLKWSYYFGQVCGSAKM